MNLPSLHQWLFSACPATADVLLHELQLGHRTAKAAYEGLPNNSVELSQALRELEADGLLVKRDAEWYWLNEVEKPEPQLALF